MEKYQPNLVQQIHLFWTGKSSLFKPRVLIYKYGRWIKTRLSEKHLNDNSCVKILLSMASTTKEISIKLCTIFLTILDEEISNEGSFPTSGGDTRTMKK